MKTVLSVKDHPSVYNKLRVRHSGGKIDYYWDTVIHVKVEK
jgi:hypothetical protein